MDILEFCASHIGAIAIIGVLLILLFIIAVSIHSSNYVELNPSIRFTGNTTCINNGTMWYTQTIGKSTFTYNQYFNKSTLKTIVSIYDKLHNDNVVVC